MALALARALGGTIINADSMQVYRELRVLTARPTPAEEASVPHRLYGVRPAAEPGSVAWWRGAALDEIRHCHETGRLPILCGGTGLYLASLSQGLALIPEPGSEARAEARALLAELGPAGLHARLATADPDTAARLRPSDSQRLARAWEVWRGTGTGLAAWHGTAGGPGLCLGSFVAILLDPPRSDLRAAIAARFRQMLANGAIEEVRSLLALGLDPALPAMRAHGVPELTAFLRGDFDQEEAALRAISATSRYTKRQATWFRHHPVAMPQHTHTIHARIAAREQFSERTAAGIIDFIHSLG